MEGTLSAESGGLDQGTTFTFAIPLIEQESPSTPDMAPPLHSALRKPSFSELGAASRVGPPPPSPQPSSASSDSPDSPCPPLRVLVAEDDPLCAAVMRKILERLRVAGTIVGDGLAAVNAHKTGALLCLLLLCATLTVLLRHSRSAISNRAARSAQCVRSRAHLRRSLTLWRPQCL